MRWLRKLLRLKPPTRCKSVGSRGYRCEKPYDHEGAHESETHRHIFDGVTISRNFLTWGD